MKQFLGKLAHATFLLRVTPRELFCLTITIAVCLAFYIAVDHGLKPINEARSADFSIDLLVGVLNEQFDVGDAWVTGAQQSGEISMVDLAFESNISVDEIFHTWNSTIQERLSKIDANFQTTLAEKRSLAYSWRTAHKEAALIVFVAQVEAPYISPSATKYRVAIYSHEE